jgi:hypothetical protein
VDDQRAGTGDRSAETVRRPYVAPELVEYGTVAKLTQTGGRTTVDFLFNLRRMASGGGMM